MRIAIAGGGIGGVAAALSLTAAGFEVDVYEKAPALAEVGAGLQLGPNATRLLIRLGLGDALSACAVRPAGIRQRRWRDGATLLFTPLADAAAARYGAPYLQLHRADLLGLLVEALPPGRLHLGRAVTGFADNGGGVTLTFADGSTAGADILVGADGVHSTIRRQLFGAAAPRFTDCAAYRGLIPAERVAHLDIPVEMQVWMGPGRHLVHYYVSSGRYLNFVANVEHDGWRGESWTEEGDRAAALAAYAGWHPQVRGILEAVERTFIWAIFDRPPLPRWSVGRVTLLGDACHPMQPHFAQGAAQAIEDGAALAACLSAGAGRSAAGALKAYEALRRDRTARVQARAAENKRRFHLPDGPEQAARDRAMATDATDWSAASVDWLFGHDAGALDAATRARLAGRGRGACPDAGVAKR